MKEHKICQTASNPKCNYPSILCLIVDSWGFTEKKCVKVHGQCSNGPRPSFSFQYHQWPGHPLVSLVLFWMHLFLPSRTLQYKQCSYSLMPRRMKYRIAVKLLFRFNQKFWRKRKEGGKEEKMEGGKEGRGRERKVPGKGKDRENRKRLHALQNWNNPGAELLWSCMLGKGRSAPRSKLITYLKNVNRIPGQTPLTQGNQGERRLVCVLLSTQLCSH